MWVRAIETYGRIYRQIAPKRERLQEANEALTKKQAVMKESQLKLQEVKDKLADLTRQYEEKLEYKEKLRKQIEETELKLTRAQQLMSGLSGEKVRYVLRSMSGDVALLLHLTKNRSAFHAVGKCRFYPLRRVSSSLLAIVFYAQHSCLMLDPSTAHIARDSCSIRGYPFYVRLTLLFLQSCRFPSLALRRQRSATGY